jgi:hypothetical protein
VTTTAERAVIEAVLSHDHAALINGQLSPRLRRAALDYRDAQVKDGNLNPSPQPDLDALNAAVAEAYEAWVTRTGPAGAESVVLHEAVLARRAALAPKPRYEARGGVVYDTKGDRCPSTKELAALLNKEKP